MKRWIVLVAPLALVACGAPAAETPKEPPPIVEAPRREPEPKPPPPAPSSPVPVDPAPRAPAPPTQIDLGGASPVEPPPAPAKATPPPADTSADAATVAMSERLERERREKRVADAEAAIAELEKRRLAISNPYLPRPQLPPEEAAAWEGLDGV